MTTELELSEVVTAESSRKSSGRVAEFVQFALTRHGRRGICEVLEWLCQRFECHGAILWQEEPQAQPLRLFAVATWMASHGTFARHDLPLKSATGLAITKSQTVIINDAASDPRPDRTIGFLQVHGIKKICCIPISMLSGYRGCLNFYRSADLDFFEAGTEEMRSYAEMVPYLFDSLLDSFSVRFLNRFKDVLQAAEGVATDAEIDPPHIGALIQGVAQVIGDELQCLESSIFLENWLDSPGTFECFGTTHRPFLRQMSYRAGEPGLTGYVLNTGRPLKVPDLRFFNADEPFLQLKYNGISWSDWLDIRATLRRVFDVPPDTPEPPASFMAAPIGTGSRVLGVVRCCTLGKSPHYFSDHDLEILAVIGAHLGEAWQRRLQRMEMLRENRSWRRYSEAVGSLNRLVQRELRRPYVSSPEILNRCLQEVEAVLPAADILDIRLFDETRGDLYFAATRGALWDDKRRAVRYPVTDPPKSVGAWVFSHGTVRSVPDVTQDSFYQKIFAEQKSLIAAPIVSRGDRFGVVTIATTGPVPFPQYAKTIAEIIGQQLGLYLHLMRTVGCLKTAETELEKSVTQQTQAYEDWQHQIKSPILQASARCNIALAQGDLPPLVRANLQAIRGMVGRARQVARNLSMFVQLAKRQEIEYRPARLLPEEAFKEIVEICVDNRRYHARRKLEFKLVKDSFEPLMNYNLQVDKELFRQAVNNIVDNAFKYSYRNTTVSIQGGVDTQSRFFLAVTNVGIPIRNEEIPKLLQRNVRGDNARLVTGEGSGLGLWLVDHIMQRHGGSLDLSATTSSDLTEVRLLFPIS